MVQLPASPTNFSLPDFSLLSCNTNGVSSRDSGYATVDSVLSKHTVCALQETAYLQQHHYGKWRASSPTETPRRSNGVAFVIDDNFPGFGELSHLAHLDVPAAYYMVVHTKWEASDVYLHNVYAPCRAEQRPDFFSHLPRAFPDNNATSQQPQQERGHTEFMKWLAAPDVLNPWRLHHPTERLFSGPHSTNRLDYILLSPVLGLHCYADSGYPYRTPSSTASGFMPNALATRCAAEAARVGGIASLPDTAETHRPQGGATVGSPPPGGNVAGPQKRRWASWA
ncbi:hypothetical protein ACHHYP_11416 [Achlya hypogyna]|uniref:Uncharacterized protein n=1 Tax=Achlya hypogyna TaxID=1202772 RepID=A0A1V9YJA9_ACHHY|nr:hypothetical protein ACHHYP_11416 [Achlya hypogyna]